MRKLKFDRPKGTINSTQAYANTLKGWIETPEGRFYCKSKWEMNWCFYLSFLKKHRQILDYKYESKTFWFENVKRGVRSYLIDFEVTDLFGAVYYQEVKGYMDAKSKTKLKRMRIYYPDVRVEVIDEKRYKAVKRSVSGLIKDWIP